MDVHSREAPVQQLPSKKVLILVALAVIAALVTVLFFISPQEIVEALGVENTYLVIFLLAVVGGISTLTGASVFLTIATFASGGSNPWLLGLTAGLGIFISDTIFYLLALKGSDIIDRHVGGLRRRLESLAKKASPWMIRAGVFVYVGVSPLPNDVLMVALALARVPYSLIGPSVFLGSIAIATITAHFGEFVLSFM